MRIIRNGVGIHEHANIDLPGIKGLWALKYNTREVYHNCLIIAFVGQTRSLMLNGEEVEEMELPGMEYNEQTFYSGNVADCMLQVSETTVRLISNSGEGLITQWRPSDEKHISVVTCNPAGAQLALACGRHLYFLAIENKQIVLKGHSILDYEIACIDISPIGDNVTSEICSVGLWTDISVQLLHLPTMKLIYRESLGGEIIPRSVLMCRFDGILYLLVALGDGTLLYFRMDSVTGALVDRKKMTLGTQPTTLKTFNSRFEIWYYFLPVKV